jgi:hypothetical protein
MNNSLADDARTFLRERLSFACAPSSPLRSEDWAAVAFDRNIHSALAPEYFWDAFLRSVSDRGDALITMADASIAEGSDSAGISLLPSKRMNVYSALLDGERFLRDQVIFGPSRTWACLLDQDVTLFAGDVEVIGSAIDFAGGANRVEQQMYSDFGVEKGADSPLNEYLSRLVSGWRRVGPVTS